MNPHLQWLQQNSDTSIQSASETIPLWQVLKTIYNSYLKYHSAKHYPVLTFSSTNHDHAPQADGAESNNHLSGDEELDFYTRHVPIRLSPENIIPAIHKNILIISLNSMSHNHSKTTIYV